MINEVTQLKFTQWLHTSPDRPYEEWLAEITASARTDAPPLTFIAICTSDTGEKDLAGFVSLVQIPENAGFENSNWVITLYVKPQYRKNGIGTHLVRRCIQENQRWRQKSLYLWTENKALTNFYTKRGWRIIDNDQLSGEDVMVYTTKKR